MNLLEQMSPENVGERLRPCMLLNASHPRERRTQSAGHDTGHFVSTRRNAGILHRQEKEDSREERYANAFGTGAPDAGLRRNAEIP
jgi:Zn-dependent peptidase ImmA (M78 family)